MSKGLEYIRSKLDLSEDSVITCNRIMLKQVEKELTTFDDIEEEIGCPLDVVIKATRDGIYATRRKWHGTDKIEVFEKFDVTFDGYSLWNQDEYPYNYDEMFEVSPICNEFRIYDYKKTWWLKEDMSE